MTRAPDINYPEADRAGNDILHPRNVFSLLGHSEAEERFARLYWQNKLHHAWLISGPTGIGKATLAYRMIRRVLGGVPQTEGHLDIPEADPIAQRISSLGHGDFLLIRRPYDHKTKKLRAEIPISETRKISNFFSRKPSEGGWRVCLIDTIDEMNRNATNAALKTLEEPPEKTLIILLSNAPGRLLPTIRSRCLSLPLRPVPQPEMQGWLGKHTSVGNEHIEAAIKLSGGAPGMALALVEHADTVLRPLKNFMAEFPRSNPVLEHALSDTLSLQKSQKDLQLFWDCLDKSLHAQAVYVATGMWQGPYRPIALDKTPDAWAKLKDELGRIRRAQEGLNMNKKTVLTHALSKVGA
ncbi:MAG: DNA polymerase III subunit delta' [Robiginitomaculum sp.]